MTKYTQFLHETIMRSVNLIKRYPNVAVFLVLGMLAGGYGTSLFFINNTDTTSPNTENILAVVELRSIGSFKDSSSPLSITGEVRSRNEAILRFEVPGRITNVYKTVGQFVQIGTLIAEVENSSQRAGLAQANAQLTQAELALEKAKVGVRNETLNTLEIAVRNSEQALENTKLQAVETLRTAYATADDAVRKNTDQLLANPTGTQPRFMVPTSNSQLSLSIQTLRIQIQNILARQANTRIQLSLNTPILLEIEKAESEFAVLRKYMDTVVSALSVAIPTSGYTEASISALHAEAISARSAVNGASQAVAAAKQSILSAEGGVRSAKSQLQEAQSGTRIEDLSSLEAGVVQAKAAVQIAQANLEKTRLRSPISGTISSLPITHGQFVSQFALGAIIINENALEVVAFISERDKTFVYPGQEVTINDSIKGVVSSVASGLDLNTRRIEIRIGVREDANNTLTHGSIVRVSVPRSSKKTNTVQTTSLFLPLSAIKITASENTLFTVNEEGILEAIPVALGDIQGDRVKILTPLDNSLMIVSDARGKVAGEKVKTRMSE